MLKKLVSTPDDWTLTVLRVVVGIVFFAHGAQKMLGWFGGFGFEGTMNFFTTQLGIPTAFAFLAIVAEFFGGLGLIAGLLTRIAAFGVAAVMAVAVAMVHSHVGFFMNWNGNLKGEGYEYHLLVLAITAVLMARGAGAFSLDRIISGRAASEGSHHHLPVHA
jgi:putative oxidoreductase